MEIPRLIIEYTHWMGANSRQILQLVKDLFTELVLIWTTSIPQLIINHSIVCLTPEYSPSPRKQGSQITCHKIFNFNHCLPPLFAEQTTGVGVTKAPFVNFSVSKIFDLAKVPVIFFESLLYLTGITAAELRRYLSNINVIFNT